MSDGVPWGRLIEVDKLEGPHAWIQWKGTDACMDVHCSCGHHGHVDAGFAYFVKCSECGKVWGVGQSVRLHELSFEEEAAVVAMDACLVREEDCDGLDRS